VRKHVTPYPTDDPRYVPTIPEELALTKAVTATEIAKIYHEYLGGQNGEVAIVGDFDGEEAVKALTEIFDGWKAQASYARLTKTVDPSVRGGLQEINLRIRRTPFSAPSSRSGHNPTIGTRDRQRWRRVALIAARRSSPAEGRVVVWRRLGRAVVIAR
jgi:zinc protease